MNDKLTNKLLSIKVNNNVCEYIGLLPSNLTRKAFSLCLESPTISLSEIKKLVPTSSARNAISYCPEIMGLPKKYRAWAALQCKCNEIGEVVNIIKLHERYAGQLKKIDKYDMKSLSEDIDDLSTDKNVAINKLYEDEEYVCLRIDNKEAAVKYGKGTKWCITQRNEDHFADYTSDGSLFYFILNKCDNSRKNDFAKVAINCGSRRCPTFYDAKDNEYYSIWETENLDLVTTYLKKFKSLIDDDSIKYKKSILYKLRTQRLSYKKILAACEAIGKEKVLEMLINGDIRVLESGIPLKFFPKDHDFSKNIEYLGGVDRFNVITDMAISGRDISECINYIKDSDVHKFIGYKMNLVAKGNIVRRVRKDYLHKLMDTRSQPLLREIYRRMKRITNQSAKMKNDLKTLKSRIK